MVDHDSGGSMPRMPLTRPVLERLAARFRALGEPNRLAILAALLQGERSVSDLIEVTGLGQANVSKHLLLLHQQGFVERRKEGLNVYYRLADDEVFHICDVMCGRLEREAEGLSGLLGGAAGAGPGGGSR
jgi:DNA-binding transcriptional ArsR family regulator